MNNVSLTKKIESPHEHGSSEVWDLTNNPVSQVIMLGNTLKSKFSQRLQRQYDIGAVEWKMLLVLAKEPEITMSKIANIYEMDKAAVSRALVKLNEKRLALATTASTNARSKLWRLTPAGTALHDAILKTVIEHTREVLTGISDESILAMSETIKTMKKNALEIDDETNNG